MTLIVELMESVGLGRNEISRIIETAPARYKVYPIAKRNGGERIIAQPSRELKAIQRFVLDTKLVLFQSHPNATAYERDSGIAKNAEIHRQSDVILKLDFRNFFNSIRVKDWTLFIKNCQQNDILGDDIASYSKILFWGEFPRSRVPRCLSIGAPTSPRVSNILMYDFDVALSEFAAGAGLKYTRYADDITVSGASVDEALQFERHVQKYVRSLKSPRLELNDEKRGLYTKSQRRMVTGLVVTPDQRISIGRDRKRRISSLVHRSSLEQLDVEQKSLLKGLLGFSIAAEPQFVERLRKKYGDDVVNAALKFHAPKRRVAEPDE